MISQPSDGATDLGQSLPTGLLSGVTCEPPGSGATTRCAVRWQTVSGKPRLTRYLVRLAPPGCFSAGAQPRLPSHRDPTIEGYSEHPLNALVSVAAGCS